MTRNNEPSDAMEAIGRLISTFDTAMLITESQNGEFRGRPMAIAAHGQDSELYFLTRADDEKLRELARRSDVGIVMQRTGEFLSISGKARLVNDPELIEQCWSSSDRLWFPQGPEDPDISCLAISPVYAESWDRTGMRKLEFWWEAGKALLQKQILPDKTLSGHKKVKL